MNERWKPVPGYEDLYEVSSLGNVRNSLTGKAKKPTPLPSGYLCVWLYGNGDVRNCLVSRTVLLAFKGKPPTPRHQAAHGNGVNNDNRLSNLRWATPKENCADIEKHGNRMHAVGEAVGRGVLNRVDIERIRDMRRCGCSQPKISRWIGTSPSNVCYILQGRTWSHV